jgi:phosphopantothenoylcysteine decarboxylase
LENKNIENDDEWKQWKKLGDPVLHINLRNWADILLVAPMSANTLAKFANGLCDDTLTCVARAWDYNNKVDDMKPLILAPAMNTAMWEHPVTQQHIQTIQSFSNHKVCGHTRVVQSRNNLHVVK